MPRISEMPRPGPLTGLELVPALQGGGPDGNTGVPLLLTGAPFGGAVLALRAPMVADLAATADADPGAAGIRWNNADPDLATVLFIDDADADTEDLAALLATLQVGGFVYVQGGALPEVDPDARDNFQKWQVTSITDATGYTKVGVTLQASGGAFADDDVLELTIQQPLPTPGVDRNVVTPVASSAGVVTIDVALGDYFLLPLTENVTGWVFQNVPPGASVIVRIVQDATARTVAWPTGTKWPNASAGEVSTAAGAIDLLALTTVNSGATWLATLGKGFA